MRAIHERVPDTAAPPRHLSMIRFPHSLRPWRQLQLAATLQTAPLLLATRRLSLVARAQNAHVPASDVAATPSIAQYLSVKNDPAYSNCIVFFQLGGFFEAFYDDAPLVASVCGITLTSKSQSIPMAGIPIDRTDVHFAKLLKKGHRIVLIEQREGILAGVPVASSRLPGAALLARAVTRVLTPGTAPDVWSGPPTTNHFVVALAFSRDGSEIALAASDVATGFLSVRTLSASELGAELALLAPAEMVLPSLRPDVGPSAGATGHAAGVSIEAIEKLDKLPVGLLQPAAEFNGGEDVETVSSDAPFRSYFSTAAFTADAGLEYCSELIGARADEALSHFSHLELSSLGGLLGFARWTRAGHLPRLSPPVRVTSVPESAATALTPRSRFSPPPRLRINESTARSLELVRSGLGPRRGRGCLLSLVDRCRTHMGSRLLDGRICAPLASLEPILHRLDAVEAFADERAPSPGAALRAHSRVSVRRAVLKAASAVPDLERAFTRVASATRPTARDLIVIRDGLSAAHKLGLQVAAWDATLFGDTAGSVVTEAAAGAGGLSRDRVGGLRDASHSAVCAAGPRTLSGVPDFLLAAAAVEFDVLRECAHVPDRAAEPGMSESLIIAQAAAMLCTPLDAAVRTTSAAEATAADAQHSAYAALQRSFSELTSALVSSEGAGDVDAVSGIVSGYDAALDAARKAASTDGTSEEDAILASIRGALGLPPSSPAVRVRRLEREGAVIEIDARSKPIRAALEKFLAVQLAAESSNERTVRRASSQNRGARSSATAALADETGAAFNESSADVEAGLFLRAARSTETLRRFRCDALSRAESLRVEANARVATLEGIILSRLAAFVLDAEVAIKAVAKAVAVIDLSASFAQLASEMGLTRPIVTARGVPVRARGLELGNLNAPAVASVVGTSELEIRALRHIGVESALLRASAAVFDDSPDSDAELELSNAPRFTSFIANDVFIGATTTSPRDVSLAHTRCVLLLGPNMGGFVSREAHSRAIPLQFTYASPLCPSPLQHDLRPGNRRTADRLLTPSFSRTSGPSFRQ